MKLNKEMALISVGMIAIASVAAIPLATAVEDRTNDVLSELNKVTKGTLSTLDRGWQIALKFKDPTYHYDPKDLGDPPPTLNETLANVTITQSDLLSSNSTSSNSTG